MAVNLYNQFVWLVDTIRIAGRITKPELDKKWAKSPLNEKNETEYPLRSFHRHREAIAKMFDIYIDCDKSTYEYFISRYGDQSSAMLQRRASEALSYTTLLFSSEELQKRVLFDNRSNGQRHLTAILNAIQSKQAVLIKFVSDEERFPVRVVPYFLKERSFRWFLAAKPIDEEVEVQVYDLSRVTEVTMLKDKASMPRWFKGDMFFDSYFAKADTTKKVAKPAKVKEEKKAEPKPAKKAAAKKPEPKPSAAPVVEQLSLF